MKVKDHTHRMLLHVLLLALTGSQAELFDVDDTVPHITSKGKQVRWDGGWDAMVVADSSCIRVNARGIFAKPSHWTPRDMTAAGWAVKECIPGGPALCTTEAGRVFPANAPLYNASRAWGGGGCVRGSDGRILDPGHGYDLSACDVLDRGGDMIVCGRTASFGRSATGDEVYWLTCLLAVYMVRSLSYSIVYRIQDQAESGQGAVTAVACLLVLPLALAPSGDTVSATVEEQLFFGVVCFYTVLYGVLFMVYTVMHPKGEQTDPPIFNLIAGALQVIACRLYCGAETPYNPVLIWAVGTRGILKLMSDYDETTSVTTFVDSLVLSLMCVIGFGYNPLYLAGLLTVSVFTADVFG